MKGQKGFTLIELMIVVAVIGVLASIAIPQYQKYVAKAEAASGLATMTGIKTNVEAFVAENGAFPSGKDTQTAQHLGAPANTDLPLGTIAFQVDEGVGGQIDLKFADEDVNSLLQGKTLSLVRANKTGAWTCSSTDIEASILPKNCSKEKEDESSPGGSQQ